MRTILILLLVCLSSAAQTHPFAEELNRKFADSLSSPLTADDLKQFRMLDFFDYDPTYRVLAKFVKAKKQKPFAMKTTTDRLPLYRKFGEVHFEISGQKLMLEVYQNLDLSTKPGFRDYLFLPFSDLTNERQTYIGGRYLDLRIPASGEIVLDFNNAYNPYCAYNPKFSCPIVPAGNHLETEIRAGVKKFHE